MNSENSDIIKTYILRGKGVNELIPKSKYNKIKIDLGSIQ